MTHWRAGPYADRVGQPKADERMTLRQRLTCRCNSARNGGGTIMVNAGAENADLPVQAGSTRMAAAGVTTPGRRGALRGLLLAGAGAVGLLAAAREPQTAHAEAEGKFIQVNTQTK